MSEGRTDIKKGIFRRVRVLYALFFFVGMLIAGKILYLQYGPKGPALRNKGTTITYERVKLEADRGDVLACDGRILATSVPMYEVRMDFAANGLIDSVFLRDVDSLAGSLSSFFGDKSKGAYKLMLVNAFRNRKKNRYTLISPRRVNHLEIKQIAKFPLFRLGQNRSGFIARQINKRMLPHGRMAARTIGMVNEAGTRLGIEGAFDSVLRGIDGSVMMQRVSGSFRVPVPDEMNVDPVDGIDVVTTLDVDIQDVAEKALRDQLIAMQADWGTAILMEVATGEIRAMANLTRYSDERVVEDFNYAIGMNLEPGSTEKLASLITLLDDAGASLDETYDTGDGRIVIGRAKVVDSHACGLLTLKGVFEKSSNVGFAMAVNKYYRDDPKRFVDHLCKMGLDQPLGLQIAGEQKPVIRKPGDKWWDGTTLTMMSYGYALRLTPLGHEIGLISEKDFANFERKKSCVESLISFARRTSVRAGEIDDYLKSVDSEPMKQGRKLYDILLRNEITFAGLSRVLPKLAQLIEEEGMTTEAIEEAEIQIKYNGYIQREKFIAEKLHRLENIAIPADFDYHSMQSLTIEARQKLTRIRPTTIGQASRIPGVSPADVNVLLVKFGR